MMVISKSELKLCLEHLYYHNVIGLEDEVMDKEVDILGIKDDLIKNKLVIYNGGTYSLSPLAQNFCHTVGNPEAYLHIVNEGKSINRKIYIKADNIICIDARDELFMITYLPTVPLLIGSYASTLGETDEIISLIQKNPEKWDIDGIKYITYIEGTIFRDNTIAVKVFVEDNNVNVTTDINDNTVLSQYDKMNCVNNITMWLLNGLKGGYK